MDNKTIQNQYKRWLENVPKTDDIYNQLVSYQDDQTELSDAFFRELEFGTGGLRGVIGAGTNRVNRYTIAKASQGLADYVIKHYAKDKRAIAISYDSRIKSDVFAKISAEVFAANGIKAYIFSELMPTPCLSYAVRSLSCSAGIMVTASHNPAKYNGYKVYGADGCQITENAANEILDLIAKTDIFDGVKKADFDQALGQKQIEYIPQKIYDEFIDEVKKQSVLNEGVDKDINIVYTPLNGAGLKPVLRMLSETGFSNVSVVAEQREPDGNFPTCSYPNPEDDKALLLAVRDAKAQNADLVLATDPDCDRVGIAVKDKDGEYRILSGNETGLILLEFIVSCRTKNGTLPKNAVIVKTIVTTDTAEQLATSYGIKTVDVLTGFKFIGEQIGVLEQQGRQKDFVFGFEESFGYLSGSYVRDKDGVLGAFLICEMFAYYKSQDRNIIDVLEEIYQKHGYRLNTLYPFEFEGQQGFIKMKEIMQSLRGKTPTVEGVNIAKTIDYINGFDGLPKSDVLKFIWDNGCSAVVRPSGTEPKLKIYISATAKEKEKAQEIEKNIFKTFKEIFETR